jgi:hypothetical protein
MREEFAKLKVLVECEVAVVFRVEGLASTETNRFPSTAAFRPRTPVVSVTVAVVVFKVSVEFEVSREAEVGADEGAEEAVVLVLVELDVLEVEEPARS